MHSWRWFSGEFLYCLIQHQEQLSEHSTLQGRAGSLQCTLESGKGSFCPTQEEVVVCPVWELMEGITNHCFVIVLTHLFYVKQISPPNHRLKVLYLCGWWESFGPVRSFVASLQCLVAPKHFPPGCICGCVLEQVCSSFLSDMPLNSSV